MQDLRDLRLQVIDKTDKEVARVKGACGALGVGVLRVGNQQSVLFCPISVRIDAPDLRGWGPGSKQSVRFGAISVRIDVDGLSWS